ncbi:hypothetical protein [Nonomuraea endophytica]|uniref:Secreted protein n=1 Tax=Nonomuraea endophytica TaxID=714136 RepID=A0A7W7ZZU5_9ACTN|nr:hypothetical protein [Nonomuraea endophytica]MBB5075903.1 hypothetical protein [Nonomuraea endophytica]
MFKRRVMVLSAVGVLGLAALGGSAMADETPAPGAGGKVVCTDENGKVIAELTRAHKAIAIDKDGKVTTSDDAESLPTEAAPLAPDAEKADDKVKGEVLEFAEAVPALPAEEGTDQAGRAEAGSKPSLTVMGTPPANGLAKTVSIKCEKVD